MLDFTAKKLKLGFLDNGIGFRVTPFNYFPQAGKFGILGMRDYADLLGGTPEIRSKPGKGTGVTVIIPRIAFLI